MESARLSKIRQDIGASALEFAQLLGLDGSNTADRVREMERGAKPVSGPMRKLLGYLHSATQLTRSPAGLTQQSVTPQWISCTALEESSAQDCWLMHTAWPRFWVWHDSQSTSQSRPLLLEDCLSLELGPEQGGGRVVFICIDEPIDNMGALVERGKVLMLREILKAQVLADAGKGGDASR
jgi:hypothetical protein